MSCNDTRIGDLIPDSLVIEDNESAVRFGTIEPETYADTNLYVDDCETAKFRDMIPDTTVLNPDSSGDCRERLPAACSDTLSGTYYVQVGSESIALIDSGDGHFWVGNGAYGCGCCCTDPDPCDDMCMGGQAVFLYCYNSVVWQIEVYTCEGTSCNYCSGQKVCGEELGLYDNGYSVTQ